MAHYTTEKIRKALHPFLMFLTKAKVKYKIEIINCCNPLPGKPIIYAANHSAFQDVPIALRAIGKQAYVLVGKQNLGISDRIFFALNGTIWVDRCDKKSRGTSKETAIEYLKKGRSMLWFPEATWNLTANLLMLPMRWGIIETAHQAKAQIIPMALDYDRAEKVCRIKFGTPMAEEGVSDTQKGIRMLRDALATLRWELMCGNEILSRMKTDVTKLRKEAESVIDEYPPIDWAYETSCIYQDGKGIVE